MDTCLEFSYCGKVNMYIDCCYCCSFCVSFDMFDTHTVQESFAWENDLWKVY